jgi:hypothetical protein
VLATLGSYLLWVVFAQIYLPDSLESPLYAAAAAGLLLGILLRLAGAVGKRRAHRPALEA